MGLHGRIPEVELHLSNDVRVLSFAASEQGPDWTLFERPGADADTRWVTVHRGRLVAERGIDGPPTRGTNTA